MRLRRVGTCLMMLGGLLLVAGCLMGYAVQDREKKVEAVTLEVGNVLKEEIIPQDPPATNPEEEVQSVEILDASYIGLLDIPTLSLSLPVEENFSYEALNSNVCRYTGSHLEDNMVIAGHDYKCHFAGLHTLNVGDPVIFTDVLGAVYSYEVSEIEILDETDVDGLPWGKPGLTLFTCTYSGDQRVVVRCAPTK